MEDGVNEREETTLSDMSNEIIDNLREKLTENNISMKILPQEDTNEFCITLTSEDLAKTFNVKVKSSIRIAIFNGAEAKVTIENEQGLSKEFNFGNTYQTSLTIMAGQVEAHRKISAREMAEHLKAHMQ